MNPILPGLALMLCVVALASGIAMVRREPEGARSLLTAEERSADARQSVLRRLVDVLARRYGRRALGMMSDKRRTFIRHRLDAAGHPGGLISLEAYAGRKAAYTVLAAGAGLVMTLLTGNPLVILLLAFLGWLVVDFALGAIAKRRQAQIDRDLPDFLDVLAVSVSAGLGFRAALARVADALGGPLGQEVETALRQMGLGASRRTAFIGLRDRNDSESLSAFMTALLQAEELGAPLTQTLGAIAEDMRKAFAQRARREAARAAPRVSLIVTTVVMPGAILLILAALVLGSGVDFGSFGV